MRFFLFSFFFIGIRLFAEGPILEKSQWMTKFTYQNYRTHHIFDNKGIIRNNYNPFLQNQYGMEIDFGLTDCDTLKQKLSFIKVDEELDGSTQGLSDYEFVLKHAFIKQKNQLLALETQFNLPLSGDYKPAVRFGNFGGGLMLYYAQLNHIQSFPLLLSVGAGAMFYIHIPEDFLKMYARCVFCPCEWLALRATFRLDYGLNNGRDILNKSLVDFNPNEKLFRGEFEVLIEPMSCLQLSIGYFINSWGRNVGAGGGLMGSLAYYF